MVDAEGDEWEKRIPICGKAALEGSRISATVLLWPYENKKRIKNMNAFAD
jgi:hypothetical protein